jgi:hypothetical protein
MNQCNTPQRKIKFSFPGIQGVVAAYQNAISQVSLYGPTNASPIINHVASFAEQAAQENKPSVSDIVISISHT